MEVPVFEIILCDDETVFLNQEEILISRFFENANYDNYRCRKFSSGCELMSCLDDIKFADLFLLDYQMDGMNGYEIAKEIKVRNPNATIAYVSSVVSASPLGYMIGAVRFVVKGNNSFESDLFECLDTVMRKAQINNYEITVETLTGYKKLKLKEINSFESVLRTIKVNAVNGKIYEIKGLTNKMALEKYCKYGFIRCHRGTIVNPVNIKSYKRYFVVFSDGSRTDIGQPQYKDFDRLYREWKLRVL